MRSEAAAPAERPNPSSPRLHGDEGFGLLELIVVVALIGVLTAVFVPSYVGLQNGARDSATRSDLASDRTAIVSWSVDNNGLVPSATGFDPTASGSNLTAYGWSRSDETSALVAGDYSTDLPTKPTKFCLQLTSTTGATFRISSNHEIKEAKCSALLKTDY